MKQPSRRDPSWGIQYTPTRRTLWSLLSCYFIELCHCWWTQSLWDGAKPQAFLMWYCVQIMSSSLDPSIWYPSQARSGDETRSFGLLCRLLAYPLCLLNENSLLISELNPNIWNPTHMYKARMSLNSYLKTPCDASSQSYPDARYCNILLQQEPNT
jgi:hypothetical protein